MHALRCLVLLLHDQPWYHPFLVVTHCAIGVLGCTAVRPPKVEVTPQYSNGTTGLNRCAKDGWNYFSFLGFPRTLSKFCQVTPCPASAGTRWVAPVRLATICYRRLNSLDTLPSTCLLPLSSWYRQGFGLLYFGLLSLLPWSPLVAGRGCEILGRVYLFGPTARPQGTEYSHLQPCPQKQGLLPNS